MNNLHYSTDFIRPKLKNFNISVKNQLQRKRKYNELEHQRLRHANTHLGQRTHEAINENKCYYFIKCAHVLCVCICVPVPVPRLSHGNKLTIKIKRTIHKSYSNEHGIKVPTAHINSKMCMCEFFLIMIHSFLSFSTSIDFFFFNSMFNQTIDYMYTLICVCDV